MLNSLWSVIRHDTLMTLRQSHAWLTPLLFFIIIVSLFPIALGADAVLLQQAASGIIWVAALLAVLLSIDNLFRHDSDEGFLDLLLLSPTPLTLIVFGKICSHWLTNCLPLIVISPVLGLFMHLNFHALMTLIITLSLGTPVLSLLGAIGAGLVVGIKQQGLLLPILIIPFYIPVLIFGTSAMTAANLHQALGGYYAVMGAMILISLTFAPLLAGAALRVGVNQ